MILVCLGPFIKKRNWLSIIAIYLSYSYTLCIVEEKLELFSFVLLVWWQWSPVDIRVSTEVASSESVWDACHRQGAVLLSQWVIKQINSHVVACLICWKWFHVKCINFWSFFYDSICVHLCCCFVITFKCTFSCAFILVAYSDRWCK